MSSRTPPPTRRFSTVLVANRGEIACRVIATLRALGFGAVAVHSDADAEAAHVHRADSAIRLGPAPAAESYLDIDAVLDAARTAGAEAIHPGYGFLAEDPAFARACARAGIVVIGPGVEALEIMGDKIRAKDHVAAAGVPLIEGISAAGMSDAQLVDAARGLTFPLLIKPSAGGGGVGMHRVERPADLAAALPGARRTAQAAFGDDTLLLEQLIPSPRHIEVQVLADAHGDVVHLGERECSLQRRHQKVVEEAPSALLDEQTRARIGQAACDTARSVDYLGAGTVEFLVSAEEPERFRFMEMNTRLQVEHPVTEEVTGLDLVAEQIRLAAGEPLGFGQQDVRLTGHAVEARICAEVPEAGFLPSTGRILHLHEPAGPGVRVDSGLRAGTEVGADYDSLLAKVIAVGADREQAFRRLQRALGEMVVLGVETSTAHLRQLVADPEVRAGRLDTTLIERRLPQLPIPRPDEDVLAAAAQFGAAPSGAGPWRCDGWRLGDDPAPLRLVEHRTPDGATVTHEVPRDEDVVLRPADPGAGRDAPGTHLLTRGRVTRPIALVEGRRRPEGVEVWVWSSTFAGILTVLDHEARTLRRLAERGARRGDVVPEVTAPLPGTVVAVAVASGTQVAAGDPLVTIEAMKMEHRLAAPLDGTATIAVAAGDQVRLGQVLATVAPAADEQEED